MSLKDIRSECSDVAGLLQPYVDNELNAPEQEQVADHLEDCGGCRAAVSEQAWVRSTLRAMEREVAPQALRAKVQLALDEVDAERAAEAEASAPPGLGARVWDRLRELGRGGLIMVPAGAVAVALFFMAKEGATPPEGAAVSASPGYGLGGALLPSAEAGLQGDADVMRALSELEPEVGFSVQVASTATGPDLQLVGASVDSSGRDGRSPAARLRYQLPGGKHLVDRQLPARSYSPRGERMEHSGRSYHVHRDEMGRSVLSFQQGGVAHMLILEGEPVHAPDPRGTDPHLRPEVDLLLKFAARLDRR